MNRENVKIVRDHLALLKDTAPLRFNLGKWAATLDHRMGATTRQIAEDRSCGTCACIAGWTEALLDPQDRVDEIGIPYRAGNLLGLTPGEGRRLFTPDTGGETGLHPSWARWVQVPVGAAVMVLDHLLETGKVDWSIIGPRICYDENGREIVSEP